jgi:Protein of unknown function (DUF3500)
MDAPPRLTTSATTFLDLLDASHREEASLPFDGSERTTWAYWPAARRGVPLWALSRPQAKAAFRLLATLLAPSAFARAMTVIALEEVLDDVEGGRSDRRHSGDFWISVFGRPGSEPWGVRFEGHHVSVNATVVRDEVTLTPLFLGANPAVVRDGGHAVVAPLAVEERLGFELLHALTVEQRAAATLSDQAPADIVTRNLPRIGAPLDTAGVPLSALGAAAAPVGRELVRVYLDRFPDGATRPGTEGLRFGWAGAWEPGHGHYYRLAGHRLLVEFDNTQNGANHVHTVVRDAGADFGEDLLRAHYQRSHVS